MLATFATVHGEGCPILPDASRQVPRGRTVDAKIWGVLARHSLIIPSGRQSPYPIIVFGVAILETPSVVLENQRVVLARLTNAIVLNRDSLVESVKERRIDRLSWVVRNLLELTIWAEYCAATPDNAQQFMLDSARDAMDAMKAVHKISIKGSKILDVRQDLIDRAEADGLPRIDQTYSKVADVAKTLGRGEMFLGLNKVLSKFAHPTAFTVLTNTEPTEKILLEKFLNIGEQLAVISLKFIGGETSRKLQRG